mgnify:CR=1 FL=1
MEAMSPQEVQKLREDGRKILLLDVRNEDEYAEVHAKDVILHPLPTLDVDEVKEIHENGGYEDTVYCICRSGARSQTACGQLEAAGMKTVNVTGGTLAWVAAGLPTGD